MPIDDTLVVIAASAWYPETTGGAFKIATELACYLAARGDRVHYLCAGSDGRTSGRSTQNGVNVWRYPRPARSGDRHSALNLFGHLSGGKKTLRRILEQAGPARRIVLNGHTELQYLAALNGLRGRAPVRSVLSVHSPMPAEFLANVPMQQRKGKARLAAFVLGRLEAECCRRSDVVHCDSVFLRRLMERAYPSQTRDRIVECPGYVDSEQFAPKGLTRQDARRRLGSKAWDFNDTVFFCLRRHVTRMGLDDLIRACGRVRRDPRGARAFRLVIGGEGPLTPSLKALTAELGLEDRVCFVGKVPEQELGLCYRAADCFVLPTRELECFGLIVLEAFAAGTPVIATPVGAIPELMPGLPGAVLTKSAGEEAIADALLAFLAAPPPAQGAEEALIRHASGYRKDAIMERMRTMLLP